MHTLGYADDAALVDQGRAAGVQHASDRSAHGHSKRIEEGRRHDYLYQENESSARSNTVTISGEASDACKFTCSRLHCGFKFYCRHGMRAHAGICEWENELPIHRILDIKGPVQCKEYLIKWKRCSDKDNTWETRSHIHPEAIKDFEQANGMYVFD